MTQTIQSYKPYTTSLQTLREQLEKGASNPETKAVIQYMAGLSYIDPMEGPFETFDLKKVHTQNLSESIQNVNNAAKACFEELGDDEQNIEQMKTELKEMAAAIEKSDAYQGAFSKQKIKAEKKQVDLKVEQFKQACEYRKFEEAEQLLKELKELPSQFLTQNPGLDEGKKILEERIQLNKLQTIYDTSKALYAFHKSMTEKEFSQGEALLKDLERMGYGALGMLHTKFQDEKQRHIAQQLEIFNGHLAAKHLTQAEEVLKELEGLGYDGIGALQDKLKAHKTLALTGHKYTVYALAVLPDGTLASGSSDKTIRLWK